VFIIPTIYLRNQLIANPAPEAPTPLPSDPHALAAQFQHAGVEMVHIVDLDIPTAGHPPHEAIIKELVQTYDGAALF
jgi:phosphoribosylformimino-5-aminoimidazole carboxamide ribonucleotide (ProFAR) isomerase